MTVVAWGTSQDSFKSVHSSSSQIKEFILNTLKEISCVHRKEKCAQTPRASCEMHLPRGLWNTKLMITAKEGRKVLIMTTNRINGRGWEGSSFLICLSLVVPVYFRKASYVAGDYPVGALNSLNFPVIAMSWIWSVISLILLGTRVTKLEVCILHQLEN